MIGNEDIFMAFDPASKVGDFTCVMRMTHYQGTIYSQQVRKSAQLPNTWQPHIIPPPPPQLAYDNHLGLRVVKGLPGVITLGTLHRQANGKWRQRIKRKTAGHTWKCIHVSALPGKLKVAALLLGIQL